jgi:hypothetical protein
VDSNWNCKRTSIKRNKLSANYADSKLNLLNGEQHGRAKNTRIHTSNSRVPEC